MSPAMKIFKEPRRNKTTTKPSYCYEITNKPIQNDIFQNTVQEDSYQKEVETYEYNIDTSLIECYQDQEKRNMKKSMSLEKSDDSVFEVPQKVRFSIQVLPEFLQSRYHRQEKLQNTLLVLPSTKFILVAFQNGSFENFYSKISKWKSALIIYQIFNKVQDNHFGLLIKHNQRFITFDGIKECCPSFAQLSEHWQEQIDDYSCGYRVLFWYQKIMETGGLENWISEFES